MYWNEALTEWNGYRGFILSPTSLVLKRGCSCCLLFQLNCLFLCYVGVHMRSLCFLIVCSFFVQVRCIIRNIVRDWAKEVDMVLYWFLLYWWVNYLRTPEKGQRGERKQENEEINALLSLLYRVNKNVISVIGPFWKSLNAYFLIDPKKSASLPFAVAIAFNNMLFVISVVKWKILKFYFFLSSPPACLVPGAGLGRLALEISCLGEFSVFWNWNLS